MNIQEARKRIGRRLIRHTDGNAMVSMHDLGMRYMANRGVSIPELKQIAAEFEPNHELAAWLWGRGDFREMRILAFMLEETDKVTAAQAYSWARELTTMELAVQASLNLFSRLPFIHEEVPKWLYDEDTMIQGTAFVTLSELTKDYESLPDAYFIDILNRLNAKTLEEDIFLKKAISRFMRALSKRSQNLRESVKALAGTFRQSENEIASWIAEEVEYEIFYLEENNN